MRRLLRDKSGNMIILVPVIFLALFVSIIAMTEFQRLNTVAENTRDAVQTAMTQVCADNSKQIFTGAREGYAGGYKLVNANWTSNVTSSDILMKIDKKLGTTNGVKTSGGQVVYEISNLSVNVKNAPLAPVGTDGVQQLTGEATYTLTVPHSFGWSALPPMVSHLDVKSAYSPQGPTNGGDQPDPGGQQVTGVSLSASDLTMNKGDTEVLSASVSPDGAVERRPSWTSTNSNVCTVTQTGAVTGVGNGSASVVALSASGAMASCNVTVVSPVTGVTIDKSSIALNKGATEQLSATVRPSDATNRSVQWGTSDTNICTVDSSGKVTAVGAGTATVTVMTQEGGFYADCAVTVKTPVAGLILDKTTLTMKKDDTDRLTATVYPSGARPDVLWASSNSSICTVDQSGNVTAVKKGSAIVSATTKDGRYVATCNVTVKSNAITWTYQPDCSLNNCVACGDNIGNCGTATFHTVITFDTPIVINSLTFSGDYNDYLNNNYYQTHQIGGFGYVTFEDGSTQEYSYGSNSIKSNEAIKSIYLDVHYTSRWYHDEIVWWAYLQVNSKDYGSFYLGSKKSVDIS